jgi:hypothetical protein
MHKTTNGTPAEATIFQNILGRLNRSKSLNPLVVRRKTTRGMPCRPPTVTPRLRHFSLSLKGKRRMEYKPIRAAAINSQSEKSSCNWKFKIFSSQDQSGDHIYKLIS